jgi:hypothetical protein
MDHGVVVSGTINSSGFAPDVILQPNQFFTATFYQPSANLSTVFASVSSESGELTLFSDSPGGFGEDGSVVNLTNFGGLDSDGDGIPDIGEFAIGTSSTSGDTDGDGIPDNAELEQGLDPPTIAVFRLASLRT